ncbi:MAG: hypothetical protein AAF092_05520 [Pseudomonadota bacterium]
MRTIAIATLLVAGVTGTADAASILLYDQDFETPTGFVAETAPNSFRDVSRDPVNQFYGNQPVGFDFVQSNTVETVNITGGTAFGNGYSDPTGIGGNYALGMLSSANDDRLSLNFDT